MGVKNFTRLNVDSSDEYLNTYKYECYKLQSVSMFCVTVEVLPITLEMGLNYSLLQSRPGIKLFCVSVCLSVK